jgi:outer membrane protein assembly factor BamB
MLMMSRSYKHTLISVCLLLFVVGCSPARTTAEFEQGAAQLATPIATTAPAPMPTLGPAVQRLVVFPDVEPALGPWYPISEVGQPYGEVVPGVLTFRGSPNRTYYGQGPVPDAPQVQWSYPGTKMCSLSSDLQGEREWCGTGWTGQPAVWERGGELWVAFGAYDRNVHVLDAVTGVPRMDPFPTGDLIKGSLTVDPDGYPLIYVGSRDNQLRILSFDTSKLVELWSLSAYAVDQRLWNDDWDGAPAVIDDFMFVGGENSNFHIVKLNRGYDDQGNGTVAPELLAAVPGWDDELLSAIGDNNVSIESSVTIVDNTVYFGNSGGLIQGWDIEPVRRGEPPVRVFRFWIGDDTDATVVVDDQGFLFAAAEYERDTERSRSLGQVVKLDPRRPDDPVVWSVDARTGIDTGVWATPAVYKDVVIVPTADGRVLGLDRDSGETRWTLRLPGPVWSSPVVIGDTLVQGDCRGLLHGFDLSDTTRQPPELWSTIVGACIESTPVVWKDRIWVGTRGGFFHMLSDPG